MKKLIMAIVMGMMIISLTACSEEAKKDKAAEEKFEQTEQKVEEGLDKELSLDILKNEHVADAYVQEKDDTAKAVLKLKKDTTDEQKEKLVEQYNEELHEKYPDKNINVIVTFEE